MLHCTKLCRRPLPEVKYPLFSISSLGGFHIIAQSGWFVCSVCALKVLFLFVVIPASCRVQLTQCVVPGERSSALSLCSSLCFTVKNPSHRIKYVSQHPSVLCVNCIALHDRMIAGIAASAAQHRGCHTLASRHRWANETIGDACNAISLCRKVLLQTLTLAGGVSTQASSTTNY